MSRYAYSVVMRKDGTILSYSGDVYDFEYSLPEMEYLMGIDQSSTSTGFYITNKQNTFHIIGEIHNTDPDKYTYYHNLETFFQILLRNANMKLFVSEKVPPTQANKNFKGYHVSKILIELKGVLGGWRMRIPALINMDPAAFTDIYPVSWKSAIVDKSKGKGRFNKKSSIVSDLCDTYPELRPYVPMCKSDDFDAFDACGILYGYLLKNFDSSTKGQDSAAGGQLIAGDKSYRGGFFVFFTTVPENQKVVLEEIEGFLNISIMKHGVKHLNINKDYSLFSNYMMAASRNPITVTLIEDLQMKLTLQWQLNLPMNNDKIVAFIVRKAAIHGNDLVHLKRTFLYDQYI